MRFLFVYGVEGLNVSAMEAFEMWLYNGILKVPWMAKTRNEVQKSTGTVNFLIP